MSEQEVYSTELCEECGFDGRDWTPDSAASEPARLAESWRAAFAGRSDDVLRRRPKPEVWSAVEYAVHTTGMLGLWHETVSDLLAGQVITMDFDRYPDADRFPYNETEPDAALTSLESELSRLRELTDSLSEDDRLKPLQVDDPGLQHMWTEAGVTNVFACALHAIHDASHHLGDIERGLAEAG